MSQDFSGLIEYLDKKFDGVDTRFDQTATKKEVGELRIEIVNLKEDVREIKTELVDLKETVHELVGAVDKLAKAVDDLRIEYSAIAMQTTRHEKWIQQIAEKLGIKLAY
jgi:chromosome segregation ATPase